MNNVRKMTDEEFRRIVYGSRWIFAKTYAAFAPHEYIIKGKCGLTNETFIEACQYILDHGIRMFYYKHERKYLYLDGLFYWIMGDEANEEREAINRCRPDDYDIVFMQRGTQEKKYGKAKKKAEQLSFI